MSTFDNRLNKPGNFITQRTLTGAAAVDSTTYNDSNFPPANAVKAAGSLTIWVTWNGTGGTMADTIDVEPLIRNNSDNEWLRLAVIQLKKQEAKQVSVASAGEVFLRINAVSTTCTDLRVRAAAGEREVDVG